jgi:hypothetical protein
MIREHVVVAKQTTQADHSVGHTTTTLNGLLERGATSIGRTGQFDEWC